MKKKALFVATGLAMASPAHALDLSYYAGASIQRTNLEADFDFEPATPSSGTSGDDSSNGLKLFGGITRKIGRGYVGAELAYEQGRAKIERNFSRFGPPSMGQRGVIEDDRSYSLSFIGGIELQQDTYVFGRIGYARTDFDFETLSSSDVVVDSGDDTFTDTQIALGADFHFTDRIALRVEFSRTRYAEEFELVANVTGDIAEIDDVSRDAVSIGIFTTF